MHLQADERGLRSVSSVLKTSKQTDDMKFGARGRQVKQHRSKGLHVLHPAVFLTWNLWAQKISIRMLVVHLL
jgi:hypothetical protein